MSHAKPNSISPIAAAVSTALVPPGVALAQDDVDGLTLEEIIVTATKREANLQDVAGSIQAMPESMLLEMGALNTEDYTRFVPSVNWINFNTGGDNFVVFRGVNTTTGSFTATSSASVYLDEIPITATNGASPDIRMMDVSRVEALSGPQGTLFGAAAQSGTLRVITNKPDTSAFSASLDSQIKTGHTSDASHSITGVLNLPLIEDTFAIRIAAQSARDGGYVDNVLGNQPDTWIGQTAAENCANGGGARSWGCSRLEWGQGDNASTAEENWNRADIDNFRISARWEVGDSFAATLAYHDGETNSQGSSHYNPYVGDLETIGFVKNESHSDWNMASLTIEADLGFAQLVSATSFYENQRTFKVDNTMYYKYYMTRNYCTDKGAWADLGAPSYGYFYYWLWENQQTGRAVYAPVYCVFPAVNPSGDYTQLPDLNGVGYGPEWQDRFTQEIRLSHEGDTFSWLAGLYYEDSSDNWNSVWMASDDVPFNQSMSYNFMQDCATGAWPGAGGWTCGSGGNSAILGTAGGATAVLSALQNADHYWDSRDATDWGMKAVFGEMTWHMTDSVDVTLGGRWFEQDNTKTYVKMLAGHTGPDGRQTGGYIQNRWQGNELPQYAELSEFVPKAAVKWTIDDDKMVYASYSVGFRPGGVNRANKNTDWSRTLWGQNWEPDELANYEVGLRSRWADDSLQLNVTGFYMSWNDYIHQAVDPSSGTCVVTTDPWPECPTEGELPWVSLVGNVGDAHIQGVQAEVDWVPADGWVVSGNAQWIEAELDTTDEKSGLEAGMRTPNNPKFQGSLWATYTWPTQLVPGGEMFVRGQMSYSGEQISKLQPCDESCFYPQFTNDAYTVADARIGLRSPEGWQLDLYVNNLTDERPEIYQGGSGWQWGHAGQYERAHQVWTMRPREFGLRFRVDWGD